MSQHARHDDVALHAAAGRSTITGPQLELPRFQFRPLPSVESTPPSARAAVTPAPAPEATPPWRPVQAASQAPVARPAPVAAPVVPAYAPAPAVAIAWPALDESAAGSSLLSRISPVHVGVLLIASMLVLVMSSGPTAVRTTPPRLPAVAATDVLPARPGTVGAGAAAVTDATPPQDRTIRVGTARVAADVRAGGIPSPAAAANLAVAGGGRVGAADTGAVQMAGIPSPAAAERLGPATLPFQPSDGVTMPRSVGERDSHALDRHYGAGTLPMEEPALPAMTPGAAAVDAEQRAIRKQLAGERPLPSASDGTYVIAL